MTHMCVKMGWDYYTYMAQPTWFIESLSKYFDMLYKAENRK